KFDPDFESACRILFLTSGLLLTGALVSLLFRRDVHALEALRVDRLLHHAGLLCFIDERRESMRRIFSPCCARAASGHAVAPPSVAKNFRRAMWLAMCPSVWGFFMKWRDDPTLPSRVQ